MTSLYFQTTHSIAKDGIRYRDGFRNRHGQWWMDKIEIFLEL